MGVIVTEGPGVNGIVGSEDGIPLGVAVGVSSGIKLGVGSNVDGPSDGAKVGSSVNLVGVKVAVGPEVVVGTLDGKSDGAVVGSSVTPGESVGGKVAWTISAQS